MSSNNFEIEIAFKELRVSNAVEAEVADNLEIVLVHSGVKVGRSNAEAENSIHLRNGKQKIDVKFRMKNAVTDVSEDEFVFDSLGEPVSGRLQQFIIICLSSRFTCFSDVGEGCEQEDNEKVDEEADRKCHNLEGNDLFAHQS